MSEKKIQEKLEEMYSTEKGKKFISHLLRSFFPVGKGTYIWTSEKDGKKRAMRCCITGVKLISKEDAMNAMLKVNPDEFAEYLRSSLTLSEDKKTTPIDHPAKKNLPNGAVLGIECEKSDKLICQEVYEQLYNFYVNKLLSGDGYMQWLANNMMAKSGIKHARQRGVNVTDREEKAVMHSISKPKAATYSMGDLDALKSLKEKLDKEGK